MNYQEYCSYLQDKYGIGLTDYMTKSFNRNPKCSRTKEGLYVHHMDEDKMIMLSEKSYAELCPFEWQKKERLVYCDLLEHLLLHILICEYPSPEREPNVDVGYGGVVNLIVPELNDVYSGWKTNQEWRKKCHERIIDDVVVYRDLLLRFILWHKKNRGVNKKLLCTSLNAPFGTWDIKNNIDIFAWIISSWDFEDPHDF